MLAPKRVKFRKRQRGRLKGNDETGNYVAFGDYGLMAIELPLDKSKRLVSPLIEG